jgi:chromate transport protein ChrA
MEILTQIVVGILPPFIVIATIVMLIDTYRNAANKKWLWFALVWFTGPLGYLAFRFSKDRQ